MRVDIYCGGSDQPFVYEVSVAEAGHAVCSFRSGEFFSLTGKDHDTGKKIVAYFNPNRVDAIQLWEEK